MTVEKGIWIGKGGLAERHVERATEETRDVKEETKNNERKRKGNVERQRRA